MEFDSIVVGGGIAGLTSAAFLCKAGCKVLLCEKEDQPGGLIGSFDYKGFIMDAGIRAMENSGVLFPMLKALDLELELMDNTVSIGIEQDIVHVTSRDSLEPYREMLNRGFPEDKASIAQLIEIVRSTMGYMDVIYGIDNPLFMDLKNDREYILKTLLPWLFKYLTTVSKIKRLNTPIEEYLETFMNNEALIDIIAQHFFKNTPAFFALSYFSLYLDYNYPRGGTGSLIKKLTDYIEQNGGVIKTGTKIQSVNPAAKRIYDQNSSEYAYRQLIWAADQHALYAGIRRDSVLSRSTRRGIERREALLAGKTGGDSVLTLYLLTDIDKSYFKRICSAHFFYTPYKQGLRSVSEGKIRNADGTYLEDAESLLEWVQSHLRQTTFEISIPVLRDETLAPAGKTGLIISALMDYALVEHIRRLGSYEAFKSLCQEVITAVLSETVFPDLRDHSFDGFVSTPLTIEKRTGNSGGAITGWAFTNAVMPAVSSMPKIATSIKTPIPDVVQAGQWTFSPSGLPISIITGKLAADHVIKKLKR